ncbi:hypothetical protein QFZ27_000870 [Inquilinus ginsengisoli]|jgi:hypothetical protein
MSGCPTAPASTSWETINARMPWEPVLQAHLDRLRAKFAAGR